MMILQSRCQVRRQNTKFYGLYVEHKLTVVTLSLLSLSSPNNWRETIRREKGQRETERKDCHYAHWHYTLCMFSLSHMHTRQKLAPNPFHTLSSHLSSITPHLQNSSPPEYTHICMHTHTCMHIHAHTRRHTCTHFVHTFTPFTTPPHPLFIVDGEGG